MFGALGRPGVAGIGEDRFLLTVQYRRHLVDVGLVGGGAGERMDHTGGDIVCAFIPKCHWSPFLVWCIAGSLAFALFLVEAGAAMMVASVLA